MKYLLLIYFFLLSSCGSLTTLTSTTSTLRVRMMGNKTTATGADGTDTPDSMTFAITGVSVHEFGATANTDLLTNGSTSYKVINRPEAVYINEDTSDLETKTFDSITVTFDPTVTVVDSTGTAATLTLTTLAQQLTKTFTVDKHEKRQLTIKVYWGKTLKLDSTGTLSVLPPTFNMTFDE